MFFELGSRWENGYVELFNGKPRDELLNVEISSTLQEAQILVQTLAKGVQAFPIYNSLGFRRPAPQAWWLSPLAQPELA